jgi:PKD repeat protein
LWDFGDGQTSTLFEPVHVYTSTGNYIVTLRSCNDCFCDSITDSVTVTTTGTCRQPVSPGSIRLVYGSGDSSMQLINFNGNGTLFIYDLNGRQSARIKVTGGRIKGGKLSGGFQLWMLENDNKQVVARGKISF